MDLILQAGIPLLPNMTIRHCEAKQNQSQNLISRLNAVIVLLRSAGSGVSAKDSSSKLVYPNRFGYERVRRNAVVNLLIVHPYPNPPSFSGGGAELLINISGPKRRSK